jgi:hypothetical protein
LIVPFNVEWCVSSLRFRLPQLQHSVATTTRIRRGGLARTLERLRLPNKTQSFTS